MKCLTILRIATLMSFASMSTGCGKHSAPAFESRESGPAVPLIDIATDVTDPYNNDDSEPSIAVNPKSPNEIAVVAFSGGWGPNSPAPIWKSNDSGQSWRRVAQIPAPGPGLEGPGDQKIAYDADGHLYVAELGIIGAGTSSERAQDFVYRQTGGPDDLLTAGSLYGDDQPHIAVDSSSTDCTKDLYSAWLRTQNSAQQNEQSMDSFSKDSGQHLMDVGVGIPSVPNRTTRVAVAPDGKAYIVYKAREGTIDQNFEKAHFRVLRSDDCGSTYLPTQAGGASVHGNSPAITFFTNTFGNPNKGKVARARSSDAWITTSSNPSELYVAYVNRDSNLGQIFVSRSIDRGVTWSFARVTDGTHHSAYPEIAITTSGVLGVLYIDFDDSGQKTVFRQKFAISKDHGQTWENRTLQQMIPDELINAGAGYLWGDYEGLTSQGDVFYGVFTGQSINRSTRQLDPIFFKIVN